MFGPVARPLDGAPPPRKLSVALAVWLDTAQMDHDSGQGSETFEPDFEAQ